MGQSPPGEAVHTDAVGLPLLNGPTEFGGHHPLPVQFTNEGRKLAKAGDLLFCVRGSTTGRMNWADQTYAIGRGVAAVRHKEDVRCQPFVRATIEAALPQLLAAATGSTFPNVSRDQLLDIEVPPMALGEQLGISEVLASLDDKIELNRRMNETLEAMARALFRSWFVDFDPVRAKSEGRPTGLPADLEALFPNEFEDSPLGEIPKGWQVQPLGHIADVRIGKTPPRLEHHWFSKSRADVRWVSIRDLGRVDVFISETSEFLTADAVSRFRIRVVPDRTVMVSFKLTVGRVAISDGELTTNEAIAHMIPQDSILAPWFLYSYLGTFDYGRLGSTSSIATAVNSDSIRELPVLVPSTGIVRAFNERVESLFQQILVSSRESRALEDMRCDLLPRLLSGEIEVAEAEVAIA